MSGQPAQEVGPSGHHHFYYYYRAMSSDNVKGLLLALSSSAFIGASFIIKKKGLKKASESGLAAGKSILFVFLDF
jgi:Magnesium transporter NIPA